MNQDCFGVHCLRKVRSVTISPCISFNTFLLHAGLGQKAKNCAGGKKSKHRITTTFIVNAAGGSESKPIVIAKSRNPRCFKHVDKSKLPVQYYHQPKSWMTGEILDQVVVKLNSKLKSTSRSVLLFMDSAGCHPQDLQYSNIKILFLPANTTSKLQPLDLGIIQCFKIHYKKNFLRYVLAKVEKFSTASEFIKTLTILNAVRWVAEAWKLVKEDTIKKCFRKAGILNSDFSIVSRPLSSDDDPFADLDDERVDGEENEDLVN